jgi:acetyltransferase-like isoleucine patch superfamily enzyme
MNGESLARARRRVSALSAGARAQRQAAQGGVRVGRGTRFGPGVTCRVQRGGVIELGRGVEIAARTSLIAGPGATLYIGDNVFIGGLCLIAASQRIVIGSGSMLAELVTIRDHDHDPSQPPRAGRMLVGELLIGERVWVGAKATIVRRCATIGNDAVIGANALVNRPVPAGCLAAGVPAVIRRKPDEKDLA